MFSFLLAREAYAVLVGHGLFDPFEQRLSLTDGVASRKVTTEGILQGVDLVGDVQLPANFVGGRRHEWLKNEREEIDQVQRESDTHVSIGPRRAVEFELMRVERHSLVRVGALVFRPRLFQLQVLIAVARQAQDASKTIAESDEREEAV